MNDPTVEEMERAARESLEAFNQLPFEEKRRLLMEYGILGPDGHLAPRYAGQWTGDEEEPVAPAAPAK